jgi:hypothetical protein
MQSSFAPKASSKCGFGASRSFYCLFSLDPFGAVIHLHNTEAQRSPERHGSTVTPRQNATYPAMWRAAGLGSG